MRLFITIVTFCFINASSFATEMVFPLDCQIGSNCWISNLPRHYQNYKRTNSSQMSFSQVDFRCGPKTHNDHKGTDFALRDYQQMREGVTVLAPFAGKVERIRDGVDDISVRVIGKQAVENIECGNGIVITNDEYEVQLCHLKKYSIIVKEGKEVESGEPLAMVGLSGNTEYPHLHMGLRKINRSGNSKSIKFEEVDPFYGSVKHCGQEPQSLWADKTEMDRHAKTGIVYNYGFSFSEPDTEQIRFGNHIRTQPEDPRTFIGFVDIFSVDKGDSINLDIIDENGKTLVTRAHKFAKYQARYFLFAGKNLRGNRLSGKYKLNIQYNHRQGGSEYFSKEIKL